MATDYAPYLYCKLICKMASLQNFAKVKLAKVHNVAVFHADPSYLLLLAPSTSTVRHFMPKRLHPDEDASHYASWMPVERLRGVVITFSQSSWD
jgi:hypothetical protein